MKKMFLCLCGLAAVFCASAQFSLGVNANYTKYGGNLQRSTPGVALRAAYESGRIAGVLSFTNGFPITEKGMVTVTNMSTGASKNVAAQAKLNFKTITLMGNRTLIGDEESTGKFYLGFGGSYVMAKYSESITETYESSYTAPEMTSDSENGFVLNAVVGGEYKIGTPSIFAEAGLALPANKVGNSYVDNSIPAHYGFNVGVKIPLGGGSY